uniref:Uncharacterized protein n=1 Tax=Hyaloperonospora arabidopsidis (strain Emoy2) TaxID=559515 RepID=M4BMX4_HYAAE
MQYSALSRKSTCFPLHYEPERTNRCLTSSPLGKSESGLGTQLDQSDSKLIRIGPLPVTQFPIACCSSIDSDHCFYF